MSKFIVDLWLDGYDTDAEREKAEEEFIRLQMGFKEPVFSISIQKIDETHTIVTGQDVNEIFNRDCDNLNGPCACGAWHTMEIKNK